MIVYVYTHTLNHTLSYTLTYCIYIYTPHTQPQTTTVTGQCHRWHRCFGSCEAKPGSPGRPRESRTSEVTGTGGVNVKETPIILELFWGSTF